MNRHKIIQANPARGLIVNLDLSKVERVKFKLLSAKQGTTMKGLIKRLLLEHFATEERKMFKEKGNK